MILTLHFTRGSERYKRKALRGNASDAEQELWRYRKGKQLGTKFRRQYSVDAYVLDFSAPRSKLAIEVDGTSHFTAHGVKYDQERTAYLKQFGVEVLRFTNLEIVDNIDGVLGRIEEVLQRRKATSP